MRSIIKILMFIVLPIILVEAVQAETVSGAGAFAESLRLVESGDFEGALLEVQKDQDVLSRKIVEWYVLAKGEQSVPFERLEEFITKNPDWPWMDKLKKNAEMTLAAEQNFEKAMRWFTDQPPETGDGMLLYARALAASGIKDLRTKSYFKSGFVNASLNERDAIEIFKTNSEFLSQDDILKRASRLLWEEKTKDAEILLPLVSAKMQELLKARIAVIRRDKNAKKLIKKLSQELQKDSGLLYDRIKQLDDKKDATAVRSLLLSMSDSGMKPELLWRFRAEQAQNLILSRDYKMAYSILSRHGMQKGESFARAEFLSGWVALTFMNDPKKAYKHFYKLHHNVSYPVSLSRAAYWAGVAARDNRNKDIAESWFKIASGYPTTFFGQKALEEVGGKIDLTPHVGDSATAPETELFKAVKMLGGIGEYALARTFIFQIQNSSKSLAVHRMAARIGFEIGQPGLVVKAAKNSMKQGIILLEEGYPRQAFEPYEAFDKSLAMAVARQESEFDEMAVSPAGAVGLMQLLPSTARSTAAKIGIEYSDSDLFKGSYNLALGSYYLKRLMDNYGGSLPLSLAAYNAGPGRVEGWLKKYGDPRDGKVSELNWIEMIPFEETRNYVHRVMENYAVYKVLESTGNN